MKRERERPTLIVCLTSRALAPGVFGLPRRPPHGTVDGRSEELAAAFLARTPGWARARSGHGKERGRGHRVPVLYDAGNLVEWVVEAVRWNGERKAGEGVIRLIYTTCVKMLPFSYCIFRSNFRLWTGERTSPLVAERIVIFE
jgi:hypothetical protein